MLNQLNHYLTILNQNLIDQKWSFEMLQQSLVFKFLVLSKNLIKIQEVENLVAILIFGLACT